MECCYENYSFAEAICDLAASEGVESRPPKQKCTMHQSTVAYKGCFFNGSFPSARGYGLRKPSRGELNRLPRVPPLLGRKPTPAITNRPYSGGRFSTPQTFEPRKRNIRIKPVKLERPEMLLYPQSKLQPKLTENSTTAPIASGIELPPRFPPQRPFPSSASGEGSCTRLGALQYRSKI